MAKIITVRQHHLDKGIAQDCNACPIAQAILEQIPNCNEVYVDLDYLRITIDRKDYTFDYESIPNYRQFMELFDNFYSTFLGEIKYLKAENLFEIKFKEFSFELDFEDADVEEHHT